MATETISTTTGILIPHPAHLSNFFTRSSRAWMVLALGLVDVCGLMLANLLALGARGLLNDSFEPSAYLGYLPLGLCFLVLYARRGLYSSLGASEVDELYHLTTTTTIGFLIISAMSYFLKSQVAYSRLVFCGTWLLALAMVPAGRILLRMAATRLGLWGLPVVVIGSPEAAEAILSYFKRFPKVGLRPVAVFQPRELQSDLSHDLIQFCQRNHIRTGLVLCSGLNELERVREEYRDLFENIILVNGQDNGLQLSGVTVHEFGGILTMMVRQNLLNPWSQLVKRLIDLLTSGLGLLALSPLFALLSVLIKLDSRGRVFYRQVRVGRGGKDFTLLKFRTMHMNADEVLKAYLESDPALQQEWDTYQKLQRDPRITRVGSLLRKFSLDELPQLWNVLRGEMSLVGPRPIMVNQKALYGPRLENYVRVTPGMTGVWQVSGRNTTSFEQRTEFDMQYVMNWSIWLDVYLLVRTAWVVLRHDGA